MKRWIYPLLCLSAIALVITTPLPPRLHCSLTAIAQQIRSFGQHGRSGRAGESGTPGNNGPAQTVWADGTSRQIYLRGGEGRDGGNGEPGDRASCNNQPRNVRHDLQAPDGGNGGNGGDGGAGGNGGALTLYYRNIADLRQIYVDAGGGRNGRGGQGGEGAPGCRCRYTDWTVETCTGTPGTAGYSCQTERFICRDGDFGSRGRAGRDGQPGQPGQLWLVNQDQPLLPDNPSQSLSLAALGSTPVAVSKNLWQQRGGALGLLAPGSVIANEYQEYVGRVEGQGQIVWDAPRSATAFATDTATMTIQDSGAIAFQFSPDLWLAGEIQVADALTTYRVTQAVRASEATQLSWGTLNGQGLQLTIAVLDLAAVSDYVDTQFQIRLRTADGDPNRDRRVRYITRYEGPVAENLVSRNHNRFEVALGRIPGVSGSDIRRGNYAEIELTMVRSLGGNSTSHTLSWRGEL